MTNEITRPKKQIHPNSLANLKPYKPGTNGHGRVYPLKERLAHALDHPLRVPDLDAPAGEQIVYSTLQGAMLREPAPFHEVWDRVEGKISDQLPPQNINIVFVIGKGYQEVIDAVQR